MTPPKYSIYMNEADREALRVLEDRWEVGMAEALRRAVREANERNEQ